MSSRVGTVVVLAAAMLGAGCDEKADVPPPPPVTGRSNAVAAKATSTAVTATPTATAVKPAAPRQLCKGQDPRPAPKGSLKTAAAAGVEAPGSIAYGVGKWVWLNLWAAWCAPCKEEMPRIIAWKEKLSAAGVMIDLAFVSIDDDERQMRRFLEGQPQGGVRASYWLPEGEGRGSWMGALGLKETTQLPVQALVAPSGQVTCVIQGAVEDGDYPAIAAFVGARR
jgi:thiol-disulfide isomerase/thioredoxin